MPTPNDHLAEAAFQDELAEAATDAETKDLCRILADIAREQAESCNTTKQCHH